MPGLISVNISNKRIQQQRLRAISPVEHINYLFISADHVKLADGPAVITVVTPKVAKEPETRINLIRDKDKFNSLFASKLAVR